jgi:hypothetical protein
LNIRHTLKAGGNDEGGYSHCCLNGMISGIDITRYGQKRIEDHENEEAEPNNG